MAVLVWFRAGTVLRERQTAQQAAPDRGYYVPAGDIKIFVQESGPQTRTSVVLIHGFGAWSETWQKTMQALAAQNFHVYALDMPPFGFSEKVTNGNFSRTSQARRIIAVLDNLHLNKVVLIGHSVGARPTIETALLIPSRVQALVLVDAALAFGTDGQFQQNAPSWLVRGFFAIRPLRNMVLSATATNPLMTKKLLSTFVADPVALTPQLLDIYQKPFVVKDSTNRLGDWLKVLSVDQDNSLSANFHNFSRLTMPTFIMWGDKDTVTPLWQGQRLQKLIPGSELMVIPKIGHIPQIENPEQFNSTLLQFLQAIKK